MAFVGVGVDIAGCGFVLHVHLGHFKSTATTFEYYMLKSF